MKKTVAVAGATGYAGGEVLRLLSAHPNFEIRAVTANSSAGTLLGEHHPHLSKLANMRVQATAASELSRYDVVVLALPHGASGAITQQLIESANEMSSAPLLVDCGADHRLTDSADWRAFYGSEAAPAWTYGMPELLHAGETTAHAQRAALAGTRTIAVPGCNATAVTLALQPGIAAELIASDRINAVLAVGYSGAGKSLKPHLSASVGLGNAQPYAVGGTHRHIPEIIQNLVVAGAPKASTRLSFTPVLVPMRRGILATVTAPVTEKVRDAADPQAVLRAAWETAYGGNGKGESVIDLLPEGVWPSTAVVAGSGNAHVQVAYDAAAGLATVICAIDNLGKGTASAAVQSLNLALGIPETTGVITEGVAP